MLYTDPVARSGACGITSRPNLLLTFALAPDDAWRDVCATLGVTFARREYVCRREHGQGEEGGGNDARAAVGVGHRPQGPSGPGSPAGARRRA
eukprot:1348833-Pyramimonas_sp.AAC.1